MYQYHRTKTCGKAENGWPATKGYDLATGLGVPNFSKLRTAALNGTTWRAATAMGAAVDSTVSAPSELHKCDTDADCSGLCTYCQNGVGKVPPYVCHAPAGGCCLEDQDCDSSYCMNGPGHAQPWKCHGTPSRVLKPETIK